MTVGWLCLTRTREFRGHTDRRVAHKGGTRGRNVSVTEGCKVWLLQPRRVCICEGHRCRPHLLQVLVKAVVGLNLTLFNEIYLRKQVSLLFLRAFVTPQWWLVN